MSGQDILTDIGLTAPILMLCVVALAVMIYDWFLRPEDSHRSGVVGLFGLAAIGALLTWLIARPVVTGEPVLRAARAFQDRMIVDPMTLFFMWFFVMATFATGVISLRAHSLRKRRVGEYFSLLILATAAMAVLVAVRDFILLYLAIETLSFCAYVLVGYARRERLATEASLKYILYGGVASGVMLFGISYIYGITGTTEIAALYDPARVYGPAGVDPAFVAGRTLAFGAALVMILAGLGFKMAVVPFHSWCPDVYEGAPTPITAYLSVASKAAGFAAMLRILFPLFGLVEAKGAIPEMIARVNPWLLFWAISAATMTLGNLVALWQRNVKRLLAYSSIAHAGYMAMAFTVTNREAFEAVMIYLVVYLVMNLGAFFTVLLVENATGSADLSAYSGLVRRSPLLVVVLTIFLLSLLGIPPTAGFMAKFKMFGALVQAATWPALTLVIVGIVNSVISAYYYLKVVKTMVFDEPADEGRLAVHPVDGAIVVAFAAAVFILFLFWTPVQRLAESIPFDIAFL